MTFEKMFNSETLSALVTIIGFFASFYFSYKLAFKKGDSSESSLEPKFEIKVTSSFSSSSDRYSEKNYDDAKLEELYKRFHVNGNKSIQKDMEIDLIGDAEKINSLTRVISGHYNEYKSKECSSWDCEGSLDTIHYSLLKNEVEVSQLSQLASMLELIYNDGINSLKKSSNYTNSGEHDQESILDEWREKFSEDFVEKCFNDDVSSIKAYDFLEAYLSSDQEFVGEDYSIFKELSFNDSKRIFDLAYRFERDEVFKAASDSYRYKDLKKLVDSGVLVSGLNVDAEKLLQLLKVSDIRELAKEKGITIKGRKKEDLLKSFLEQSNVSSKDIGKYVAVREIFAPNPDFIQKHNFHANKISWSRSRLVAEYIEERVHSHADSKEFGESVKTSFNKRFINSLKTKVEANSNAA